MTPEPMRDKRLPYKEIDQGFLPPRDPVLGYIKIGGKDPTIRYSRTDGSPWVRPMAYIDPARFEVTTREKRTTREKGQKKSDTAGETFTVDLGYVRDEAFHALEGVGSEPTALRVRLLYRHWQKNFIAFMGAWGGGEWVCRGNGVEATDAVRGPCVCPCPRLKQFEGVYAGDHPNDGKSLYPCKPNAQLNVMLEDARVFGSFHAYKTTSYETVANITKSLQMFEEMFKRVDGLPLELRVMAASKQIPGGGRTTQPIVTLVLPAAYDTARQVAAAAAEESRKFLPAGRPLEEDRYMDAVVSEMEAEASSYAGEFHPAEEVEEMKPAPMRCYTCGAEGVELVSVALHEEGPRRAFVCKDCEKKIESGEIKRDDDGRKHEENAEKREPGLGRVAPAEDRPPATPGDPPPAETAEDTDDPDRDKQNQLARAVLGAAGFEAGAIDARIEYHRKTKSLGKLLDRLENGYPEIWAKVAQTDVFEEVPSPEEPEDGLSS